MLDSRVSKVRTQGPAQPKRLENQAVPGYSNVSICRAPKPMNVIEKLYNTVYTFRTSSSSGGCRNEGTQKSVRRCGSGHSGRSTIASSPTAAGAHQAAC